MVSASFENSKNFQIWQKLRRYIFHAVHSYIHLARYQCIIQCLSEDSRAHGLQGPVLNSIALRLNDANLCVDSYQMQRIGHRARLE